VSADAAQGVQHVFVLMLENRSFDHFLGFSQITGTDAETGRPTTVSGLAGRESNTYNGLTFTVTSQADQTMPLDPGHEFTDVLTQLCGPAAVYRPGGTYPAVNNTGFVDSYVKSGGASNPGEIMKCFGPGQLPVLTALAREFAVCDGWRASMPGPTWPNRFFMMAASSGGLDHSPARRRRSTPGSRPSAAAARPASIWRRWPPRWRKIPKQAAKMPSWVEPSSQMIALLDITNMVKMSR
jgi:phospholipase C